MVSSPFAPGSVALKLHLHDELPVEARVTELLQQAERAEKAGFDGVVLPEHHAGVLPGYVPVPTSVVGWILARTRMLWAAPCPTLLLLRPTLLVAEELAWLAAAFPGRVGAAFAAGWAAADFAVAGQRPDGLVVRYEQELSTVADALRGKGAEALRGDAAVRRLAGAPLTMLSAVSSRAASLRAARLGLGVLLDSQVSIETARRRVDAYCDAGGAGPKVIVRRVWVGDPPGALYERQLNDYRRYTDRSVGDDGIISGDGATVASRLQEVMVAARTRSLTVQLHVPGVSTADVCEQIDRVGDELLPRLAA